MLKKSTKIMMMMTLIMSTIMVISSENWFSMWMGLEINMLSFIPLMEEYKNYFSSQSKMMYFLIQSLSSIMFIFIIIMNPISIINEVMTNQLYMIMLTLSMMMKMGMAPVHMWFVNIMNKMNWTNCTILMTWQKLAPMYIMSNFISNNSMINVCSILSAMIGAIGGINQTSIKKILAFSSINHLGWMTLCMKNDNEMWMKYWIIYSIIIVMLTMILSKNSITFINQMNMNMKTNFEKINMIIMMLSLGGLPPFIGFLPKWMVIQSLIYTNNMFTLIILMMSSMITLFYYMRVISPMILSNNMMNKWNLKMSSTKKMNTMMMTVNLLLPISLLINMM